jgi:hypothetical protein
LIFIDPTGWTGYPLSKIGSLLQRRKCEVLVNFMYDSINRFALVENEGIAASFDPILGGPGWRDNLDPKLPPGLAVERQFCEALRSAGNFRFVISTKIDKTTAERPHFHIIYGTKSAAGLRTFRETEYAALRQHEQNRADVRERKREEISGTADLFAGYQAQARGTIDALVEEQKSLASKKLLETLSEKGPLKFSDVVVELLQTYLLRETNVKDMCVDLAKAGKIEKTWCANQKPSSETMIALRTSAS